MGEVVYLNGAFKSVEEALVHVDDRGYNFADGVYEVIAVYNGRPFKLEEHFTRLKESAEGIGISVPDLMRWKEDALKLLELNAKLPGLQIYVQVSRGTEPRKHLYSDGLTPNVFMTVRPLKTHPEEYFSLGCKAIIAPDERWSRCYIKSIALLPNILTKLLAKKMGAFEAIQVRDGFVTEGCSSNVFIVKDGVLITPPATNYILNGITRRIIIAEAQRAGYRVAEQSISLHELLSAEEVFLTGTTTEVMPIVLVDDTKIGDGRPGRITMQMLEIYRSLF